VKSNGVEDDYSKRLRIPEESRNAKDVAWTIEVLGVVLLEDS